MRLEFTRRQLLDRFVVVTRPRRHMLPSSGADTYVEPGERGQPVGVRGEGDSLTGHHSRSCRCRDSRCSNVVIGGEDALNANESESERMTGMVWKPDPQGQVPRTLSPLGG